MSRDADDALTAIHEAGHAAVALALGRRVLGVAVGPERSEGHAGLCTLDTLPLHGWARREVAVALGGPEAERRAAGGPATGRVPGSRWDEARARNLASRLTATAAEAEELIASLRGRVAALLSQHWPAVLRLAAALQRRGALTGAQAEVLFLGWPATV